MNTREQFGKFLLLKKLTEDALGETFRAGMLGEKGMDRIVLLRVYNGQGVDGGRLWEVCKARQPIQSQLKSPNIGEGVEIGELQGIPYAAYDYVSGRNMATLLEQAAKKRNYIPIEHALLITERVALALAVASENRHQDQRILHGFVAPHLVMISNEGESRLLGFEVGPGLRDLAANPVIRQHYGRYLAPEALAGAPLERSDDIYSLGVVLFELLTGRPLPPPGPDGYASVIDQGVLATEGTPIPEELTQLLKQSLVPRDQRVRDAVTWQKTLNKVMFEGQYNPTTFNLAFFMHNLFRQEIERESQELEVEKTLPVPVVEPKPTISTDTGTGAVPIAQTAAEPAPAEDTGVRDVTQTGVVVPPQKSRVPLFISLAAAFLVVVGGGLGYFWWSGQQVAKEAAAQQAQAAPPPPVAPAEPEGPTAEEEQAKIQEQIESLIDQRALELEDNFRRQYEEQLKDLEQQLSSAREDAEKRRLEREIAAQRAAEEERQKALEEERRREAERLAAEQAATEEAARKAEAERLAAAPPPPPVVAPPPPPPARAQVRRGDLVEPGPGVVAPQIERLTPRFPEMARRVGKREAVVKVKVLVDENGKALKAELVGKEVGFGFDQEALRAARTASYSAPTKDGVPVKLWYTVSVQFQP